MWKLGFSLIELVLCEELSRRKPVGFLESAGLRSVKVWIFSDTSSSRELSSWTCTACHSLHVHATHESIVPTLGRQDRLFEGSSKQQEFQKNIYFCFIDYAKAFDSVDHNKLWKILKVIEYQTTWPASWEMSMQVRKQQLELDMEQQSGSK